MATKNRKSPQFSEEQRVEAKVTDTPATIKGSFKDLGNDMIKGLWDELLTGSAKSVPEQLFNPKSQASHSDRAGEIPKNQEVSLRKEQSEKALTAGFHREYFNEIKYAETRKIRDEQRFIEKRIEEILVELKKLTKSSKELQILFKEVTTEEVPVQAGNYHINFFEWVLSVVKNARIKVEEGANWLQLFSSKKKQKQYWNMFKKHGTTFGLSQERTMATQTG